MQTRDSLRAYDCLKIVHRDVSAAVQQQAIDVQAALQYIKDAMARNEFIGYGYTSVVPHFPKHDLYKQGWALKYMHYLWRWYTQEVGLAFLPFAIEHVERIYGWLDLVMPACLHTAFARF
jgi:hypothetical protein